MIIVRTIFLYQLITTYDSPFPRFIWLGIVGVAGLVIGLLVLGVAAVLVVRENHLSKYIIDSEVFETFPINLT